MFAYGVPGHTTYRQIAAPARAAVSDVAGRGQRRPHAVGGRLAFTAVAESQSWHGCGEVGRARVGGRSHLLVPAGSRQLGSRKEVVS